MTKTDANHCTSRAYVLMQEQTINKVNGFTGKVSYMMTHAVKKNVFKGGGVGSIREGKRLSQDFLLHSLQKWRFFSTKSSRECTFLYSVAEQVQKPLLL